MPKQQEGDLAITAVALMAAGWMRAALFRCIAHATAICGLRTPEWTRRR